MKVIPLWAMIFYLFLLGVGLSMGKLEKIKIESDKTGSDNK